MKINKNIVTIAILSISILLGLLIGKSQAVNETNETSTNIQNSNKEETTKSSNANLSNLGIKPHDFTGFRYGNTSYEVTVPEDTENIEVYATTQEQTATLTGTGNKKLEMGENKVEVVVTAEDGTKKTYTIKIIRKAKEEKETTNHATVGNGLAKLKINDLELSPKFKTNVYEYTAKYIGEDTKLKIEAEPTDESYEVEIVGNENLQEGQNFITILVSEENEGNIATYQIEVDKSLVDEEAIAKEEKEKKEQQQKFIISGAIIVGAVIIASGIWIVVCKKNKDLEKEFSGEFYYDEKEDEDDVPKALRGKRFQEELKKEEEDFARMPKEKLKEEFLNGYTTEFDTKFDLDDNRYQDNRRVAKHKGKRFK